MEMFRWLLGFHAPGTHEQERHDRHSLLRAEAYPIVDSNAVALAALALFLLAIAAWMTHLFWAVSVMLDGPSAWQAVLALAGALLLPIGSVHGALLWL
ncbi:MAG TPA: hypothetical protein PKA13_25020 [Geminicoccaceae bacterium]|nr:hypothetical protein [Geminicoccus sp.]HMU53060.1 hypothetical protein [Geminicoccaceae bacterium]